MTQMERVSEKIFDWKFLVIFTVCLRIKNVVGLVVVCEKLWGVNPNRSYRNANNNLKKRLDNF